MDVFIRYLHFISILLLAAALIGQLFFLRRRMTRSAIRDLQHLDILYALSVVVVLATGFAQWFWVGKSAEFYSNNPVFHVKITLFLIIGVISAYPTIFFARNKKGVPAEEVAVPALLHWSVRTEVILLIAMPLLASLMARGVGLRLE
ncbi:MAG: DUF2214 family protein [Verrucomicrobiota bacterium]